MPRGLLRSSLSCHHASRARHAPVRGEHPVEHVVDRNRADEPSGGVGHRASRRRRRRRAGRRPRGRWQSAAIGSHSSSRQRPSGLPGASRSRRWIADHAVVAPGRGLERRLADEHLGGERHRQIRIADPRERLGDGAVPVEDHRLGRHQPAGGVGLVAQQAADRLGLLGVHRAEQLGLARLRRTRRAGRRRRRPPSRRARGPAAPGRAPRRAAPARPRTAPRAGRRAGRPRAPRPAPAAGSAADRGSPPPSRPDAGRRAPPPGDRSSARRRTARRPRSSRSPRARRRRVASPPASRRAIVATSQANGSGAGVSPTSTTRSPRTRRPISSPTTSRSPARSSNWRRLTEPRRSRTPSLGDLADAAGAHEHAPAPDRDDEPVDARRPSAEVEDHIDHAPDVGAVGAHQREPGQSRHIDDSLRHTLRLESARPDLRDRK